MFCTKCGNKLEKGTKFCDNCGTSVKEVKEVKKEKNEKQEEINIDDVLLDAYIGENSEKIKEQKFSIPAFFFGPIYYLYRKMYLYMLALFAINIGLSMLKETIPFLSFTPLSIGLSIILGFYTNRVYLDKASNDIKKIKEVNKDTDLDTLKKKVSKKGGTNVVATILACTIIPVFIVIIIVFSVIIYNNSKEINGNDIEQKIHRIVKKGSTSVNVYEYKAVLEDTLKKAQNEDPNLDQTTCQVASDNVLKLVCGDKTFDVVLTNNIPSNVSDVSFKDGKVVSGKINYKDVYGIISYEKVDTYIK